MKHLQHLLSALALTCLASAASAATVRVDFDATLFDTRHDKGYDSGVSVKYSGKKSTVDAGLFSGSVSQIQGVASSVFVSTTDFYAYCYDLAENVDRTGKTNYTVNMDGGTARTLDFLGAVNYQLSLERGEYDPYAWLNPTSGAMGAAIQLGIWESLYDNSRNWSSSNGAFQATSGVDAGTANWLKSFYAALDSSDALDGEYVMTLTATGAQDLITGSRPPVSTDRLPPNQVPEPASLALMGLALAGVAVARRRKA